MENRRGFARKGRNAGAFVRGCELCEERRAHEVRNAIFNTHHSHRRTGHLGLPCLLGIPLQPGLSAFMASIIRPRHCRPKPSALIHIYLHLLGRASFIREKQTHDPSPCWADHTLPVRTVEGRRSRSLPAQHLSALSEMTYPLQHSRITVTLGSPLP